MDLLLEEIGFDLKEIRKIILVYKCVGMEEKAIKAVEGVIKACLLRGFEHAANNESSIKKYRQIQKEMENDSND